jgi:hypothetical protein
MKTPASPQELLRLRRRKRELARALELAPDALPGSLAMSRFRCGHDNCRCVRGELHTKWSLTFMEDGRKRTQHVPREWVEVVRERVEEGQAFQEQVSELLAINARLFVLERKQARARGSSSARRGEKQ